MAITDWNLTLDQFLDLPDATPALEYDPPCNGRGATIRQKMSPTEAHSAIQEALIVLLLPLRQHGLRLRPELRVVRGSARVPDVSVFSLEALQRSMLLRGRYPTTPPQIAIEICSPDEDREEQASRCRFYVDEWGCPLALLVDPQASGPELVAYRPHMPPAVFRDDERIAPLDEDFGLQLTPRDIWTEADL